MDIGDTIVGPATAHGIAARAILRLTGPQSEQILKRLTAGAIPASQSSRFCRAFAASVSLPGWDRRIAADVLYWPGPRSYTGQAVVELHLPACAPLLAELTAQCVRHGARVARPGEFTLRAFLAGRMDLAQAEGVLGLIEARSAEQLRRAVDQRTGGLSEVVVRAREAVLDLLADIEAGLDFASEDVPLLTDEQVAGRLELIRGLLESIRSRLVSREAHGPLPRVVLVGPPNAGKSSLFNALLGRQQALVSQEAGTTRDYVCGICREGDFELECIDTAGIGDTADSAALAAAEQTRRAIEMADLIIECTPAADPESDPDIPANAIRVHTKGDLLDNPFERYSLESVLHPSHLAARFRLTASGQPDGRVRVLGQQAQLGLGMSRALMSIYWPESIAGLRRAIVARLKSAQAGDGFSERCRAGLGTASTDIGAAIAAAGESRHEYAALHLRSAALDLGELVGSVVTEDLLDRVFSRFCIGK